MAKRPNILKLATKISLESMTYMGITYDDPEYKILEPIIDDDMCAIMMHVRLETNRTVEEVAKRARKSVEFTQEQLDKLCKTGAVRYRYVDGKRCYFYPIWVPGIMEGILANREQCDKYPVLGESFEAYTRRRPEMLAPMLDSGKTGIELIQQTLTGQLGTWTNAFMSVTVLFFAFSSIMVIMPLYIQDCRSYSATISGLVMLPGAFGQCIAQFFGGKALDRLGARPVALIGSITLLFGTIMMSLISMTSWIWWVSIWQFVRQIGMGFVLMPITTWSLNCLEPEEVSDGSAVTNTVRQIAGAIGAPVLVILMETFTALRWAAIGGAKNMYAVANVFGIQWALRVSATICFIMVVMVFFGVRGNGAGSTRDTVQRALNRVHPHAA